MLIVMKNLDKNIDRYLNSKDILFMSLNFVETYFTTLKRSVLYFFSSFTSINNPNFLHPFYGRYFLHQLTAFFP